MRRPTADEFLPLPYFPGTLAPRPCPSTSRSARPPCFFANGDLKAAASLLKITPAQLGRFVRKWARLQRLQADLAESSR